MDGNTIQEQIDKHVSKARKNFNVVYGNPEYEIMIQLVEINKRLQMMLEKLYESRYV